MFNRFISIILVSISCLMTDGCTTSAQRVDRARAAPGADLEPVWLTVVEGESGEAVTRFSYRYWYDGKGVSRAYNKTWIPVESGAGMVAIQAPRACRLTVDLSWKETKAHTDEYHEFVIRSNDNDRRVVVKLERGSTVHGTVRDVETRQPIAGVTLTPMGVGFQIEAPGEERKSTSDKNGRFELHGVDPVAGVWVEHPGYTYVRGTNLKTLPESPSDVFLKAFVRSTVNGTVRDSNGQPLEGVTVSGGDARIQTARDGTYALPSPKGAFVKFAKAGYVTRELILPQLRKDGRVTLERQVALTGKVLGPDGRPVENFEVLAGPGQSTKDSLSDPSIKQSFKHSSGQFSLALNHRGSTWIGVRAQGFAFWKVWTDVAPAGLTQIVRLDNGVSVSGKILAPAAGQTEIQARLVPRRDSDDGRGFGSDGTMEESAALSTMVSADGILRFDHVRPDRYTMHFSGPGATPLAIAVDVPPADLDVGQIRLAGRGRIEGRVFRSPEHGGGVWSFADGYVRFPGRSSAENITMLSDEDGRFSVEGVCAGLVIVGFPYDIFDVSYADEWQVQVVEGQTTRVDLLDPDGQRALAIKFHIGDGSLAQYKSGTGSGADRKVDNVTKRSAGFGGDEGEPFMPRFRVDLIPRSRAPLSFVDPEWAELDPFKRVGLSDVSPGSYRLRVMDWLGSRDFDEGILHEQEITMPNGGVPITVSLGGGCITGRFSGGVELLNPPQVIAVPRGGKGAVGRTRCDGDGNFCVRYLESQTYTLFAHDARSGWSRVESVAVSSNVTDIGEHRLAPGGTIRGVISFRRPSPVPDEIVARGPSGVSLTIPCESYSSFDRFELTGLWPGSWSIVVRSGGEILATAKAELSGTEKVRVEMTFGDDRRP